jgi:hypothetical protein
LRSWSGCALLSDYERCECRLGLRGMLVSGVVERMDYRFLSPGSSGRRGHSHIEASSHRLRHSTSVSPPSENRQSCLLNGLVG